MATEFELLNPTDKPALLAVTTPELLQACQTALAELSYKVHAASGSEDFFNRFAQVQYEIVIVEDLFQAATAAENVTLQRFQTMPMNLRRHATTLLVGNAFQTLHPMQAFQQSVHGVVNRADLSRLAQILQKVVADHRLFLNVYRDTQLNLAQGKA